jgi:hypothetical protein
MKYVLAAAEGEHSLSYSGVACCGGWLIRGLNLMGIRESGSDFKAFQRGVTGQNLYME